uniref:Phosphodiesterase n=1 Tax=Blastobotrys adeninivorans TaxID=409370 RepID=A0A060T3B6_BLAAD
MTSALFWDPGLPKALDGHLVDGGLDAMLGPELLSNLECLKSHFDNVYTFSSCEGLARHMFSCTDCRERDVKPDQLAPMHGGGLVVFLRFSGQWKEDSKMVPESLLTTLRTVSFQWAHPPPITTVLNAPSSAAQSLFTRGAMFVLTGGVDDAHIARTKDALSIQRNHIKAPAGELDEILHRFCVVANVFSHSSLPSQKTSWTPINVGQFDLDADVNKIRKEIGSWAFRAHSLRSDELVLAGIEMINHAQNQVDPEYRLSYDQLTTFVLVLRDCYRSRNYYHNFRHAIDVLQACFYFSICLGLIPPLDESPERGPDPDGPSHTACLSPLDALTLLIVAIGHDLGHPGVTNAFLVNARAPLARLYNDKSVLESFHSAALCNLLEIYWPSLIDKADRRSLVVESVLATDMALHFDYMDRLVALRGETNLTRRRALMSAILIKSADISNVARPLTISAEWGRVLGKEIGNACQLEMEWGMRHSPRLPATHIDATTNELQDLCQGQLHFINMYALPLFTAVSSAYPQIQFATDIIRSNKDAWQNKLQSIPTNGPVHNGSMDH